MKYIDCRAYAQKILNNVKSYPFKKKLVIITVGDDEASKSYVKGKIRDCEYCDIPVDHIKIEDSEFAGERLRHEIMKLNLDNDVAGIILQLPLPKHMGNPKHYTDLISRFKDVDGFRDDSPFKPCTPKGIMYLLEKEVGDLSGLSAVIIGRGELVGKPLAKMLLDADCTVTVAHSKSNLSQVSKYLGMADIVISAVGKPELLDVSFCHNVRLVVDVGVNRNAEGKLCGDCYDSFYFEGEGPSVTPVPGGVGLLTRAMLMQNVVEASTGWGMSNNG